MKILVTGASGLLGRSLMKLLAARSDFEVKGVAFSRARPPLEKLDLTDEGAVALVFAQYSPDIVVHLAAERRPDVVDKDMERARAINIDATKIIARECATRGAFLLLISTDYVFDGTSPPYFPNSPVNPLNEYGRMKLEAERVAESTLREARCAESGTAIKRATDAHPAGAVLRIPILYGPVEALEESAVTEIALALRSRVPSKVDDWAHRYPAHVDDVASAILAIIDAHLGDSSTFKELGPMPRFLLSGLPSYTKFEMINVMAKVLGLHADHIQPDQNPPKGAPRPRDCRMDTSRLESLGWRQKKNFASEIGGILWPFFGVN